MKKLFLGAAVAMSSLTFAQQFGVKGGLNVSSLTKEAGLDDQGSKVGFNAGAFVNIPVASQFSIQPEILYSQYGDKFDWTENGTTYSYARHLDYITMPVMFQYNATPSFYLEAGPEFGVLVSAKNKLKNENNASSTSWGDYKDRLNGFNIGVGLGAGYYFTPNLGINARYVAGLNDVSKNQTIGSLTYDDNTKNNVFQVGLTYKFGN